MEKGLAVNVADLHAGMMVMDLDRPWLETPFLLQGFTIKEDDEIATLKQFCQYVYVDPDTISPELLHRLANANNQPNSDSDVADTQANDLPAPKENYLDVVSVEEEVVRATEAASNLKNATESLFSGLKTGGDIDLEEVEGAVGEMVSSVIRNPDAMVWLMRVKNKDEYIYRHAIGTSVWSVALGRQLGLSKHELDILALGALVCDIGKSRISPSILNKPSKLTTDEFTTVKKHVQHSVDILNESGDVDQRVIDIVANHHERHNGSGYPRQLKGNQIPVFSRIAAIADCYDAMISKRVYAPATTPSQAVKKLYEWRNIEFQAELVETFIHAVGIYPSGSVVELTDGRVAIVLAEGRKNRLRPKVFVVLDSEKNHLLEPILVDLAKATAPGGGTLDLAIKNSLPVDAYGIDPQAYFL